MLLEVSELEAGRDSMAEMIGQVNKVVSGWRASLSLSLCPLPSLCPSPVCPSPVPSSPVPSSLSALSSLLSALLSLCYLHPVEVSSDFMPVTTTITWASHPPARCAAQGKAVISMIVEKVIPAIIAR